MQLIETISDLRATLKAWREDGQRLAFVPTMGNLHAGHLKLVSKAREQAERTVVSIFVNPMQFGQGEDFQDYPRTLDEDTQKLHQAGVDVIFAPATSVIYPTDMAKHTQVEVPALSDILCGASRPGHFVGVATIVCKLFNIVHPDIAVFGEKDFQQLAVIRRMASDLAMPVAILGVATARDHDGLALSSRNSYLSGEERRQAPALYRILQATAQRFGPGESNFRKLEREASLSLSKAGLKPDYVSIRSVAELSVAQSSDKDLVILAAAFLGKTRLIDNLRFSLVDQ